MAHAIGDFYIDGMLDDGDIESPLCVDCGTPISEDHVRCRSCAALAAMETNEEDRVTAMLERHRLIKAGLLPNRLLGETIAPIVHNYWSQSIT